MTYKFSTRYKNNDKCWRQLSYAKTSVKRNTKTSVYSILQFARAPRV